MVEISTWFCLHTVEQLLSSQLAKKKKSGIWIWNETKMGRIESLGNLEKIFFDISQFFSVLCSEHLLFSERWLNFERASCEAHSRKTDKKSMVWKLMSHPRPRNRIFPKELGYRCSGDWVALMGRHPQGINFFVHPFCRAIYERARDRHIIQNRNCDQETLLPLK